MGNRFDYSRQDHLPPIATLAGALAQIGAKEGAAALADRLRDPALPPAAIAPIADALLRIGSKAVVPALRTFLLEYRADPLFERDPKPLVAVAAAVLALGEGPERDLLTYIVDEPRTLPTLVPPLRAILASAKARSERSREQPDSKSATERQ
jgi:hypothetical protein